MTVYRVSIGNPKHLPRQRKKDQVSGAPAPGSPEWQRLMTASKVAAVLGLSPNHDHQENDQ